MSHEALRLNTFTLFVPVSESSQLRPDLSPNWEVCRFYAIEPHSEVSAQGGFSGFVLVYPGRLFDFSNTVLVFTVVPICM